MKIHSTNYFNTFIEVAEDCPVTRGSLPLSSEGSLTIASVQFRMISENPWHFTSDEVIFKTWAERQNLQKEDMEDARKLFFSKGQACLRSSPLGKRYGWGIHCNREGKVALFGMETNEYQQILNDPDIKKVKAMRSARK